MIDITDLKEQFKGYFKKWPSITVDDVKRDIDNGWATAQYDKKVQAHIECSKIAKKYGLKFEDLIDIKKPVLRHKPKQRNYLEDGNVVFYGGIFYLKFDEGGFALQDKLVADGVAEIKDGKPSLVLDENGNKIFILNDHLVAIDYLPDEVYKIFNRTRSGSKKKIYTLPYKDRYGFIKKGMKKAP